MICLFAGLETDAICNLYHEQENDIEKLILQGEIRKGEIENLGFLFKQGLCTGWILFRLSADFRRFSTDF